METLSKMKESDINSSNREHARHYISASEHDLEQMMHLVGAECLEDLYDDIDEAIKFSSPLKLPEELSYEATQKHLESLASKNNIKLSFISDALPDYSVHEIVPFVSNIRNLTTTYTPYQPERSQGTLISLWIYQCLMAQLTGFEAINASLYDRSTAIYEGICCAMRLKPQSNTVLISEGIFPQDRDVLETLNANTDKNLQYVPLNKTTGLTDLAALAEEMEALGDNLAGVVYPHVNSLGLIEDVDRITDLVNDHGAKSIAIIDPALLAQGGLKAPSEFGTSGPTIIVGEGQHLAIGPNFGGPGLGIFGVRHNSTTKNHVRATPGRFVGKAKDTTGREAFAMVLSTREQHIRKASATSNICSNQSFLATLVGASILAKGEAGMQKSCEHGYNLARYFLKGIQHIKDITLAFPHTPFFNEVTLQLPTEITPTADILPGTNVSSRISSGANLLKVSFTDKHSTEDVDQLIAYFSEQSGNGLSKIKIPEIPEKQKRNTPIGLPETSLETIKSYYQHLGDLNVSPDDGVFPLGSCTMKYNPHINDWAANLPGFTDLHPQAPLEDAQGSLEILWEIQEWFKSITGLPGVTTQPVAGAQGELVSIKMFQAYHQSKGESHRTKLIIPKSAHGTNFATGVMAGYAPNDIIPLNADSEGRIDQSHLDQILEEYEPQLSGIMVTNPNTSGIFETGFQAMAEKIHKAGGLVFMDGANLNAIAGWIDLNKLGVDAVHSNLHKTFTIPHGGGGPGDAIVAVSTPLLDFLPGLQIVKENDQFTIERPAQSIGTIHRHWGNFAHKVRCYTYLLRLGKEGIKRMSGIAVLSARYLYHILKKEFPTLPQGAESIPRMHEFILTLTEDELTKLEHIGIKRANAMARVGKLFLDFGFHAPTVAFPEIMGIMLEPTESFTKAELDRFAETTLAVKKLIHNNPGYITHAPKSTPVDRIDEVEANRNLCLSEPLTGLPTLHDNRISPEDLKKETIEAIYRNIANTN